MNEKRLSPRLMVLLVVLKGEKVYKVPIRSEIELDHLKDFNTLRRILTPLVQLYHGVGFDTRLTYDEFSIFINDLQHLGYERLGEYSSGIQEFIEVKPITENNQDDEQDEDMISQYTNIYNAIEKWESDHRETEIFQQLAVSELFNQLNK